MGRVKALLPLPLGAAGEPCSALEGLARLLDWIANHPRVAVMRTGPPLR